MLEPSYTLAPHSPGVRVASSGFRNGQSTWCLAGECAGCGATLGPCGASPVSAEDGVRSFVAEHRDCGGDFRPVVTHAERDRMIGGYVDRWRDPKGAREAFDRSYRLQP